jgi:HEAT repeat protein
MRYVVLLILGLNLIAVPATANDVLDAIAAHNKIWLGPDPGAFPRLAYTFLLKDREQPFAFDSMPDLHHRRGISLSLGLDHLLSNPGAYEVVKQYEGDWRARPVAVLSFTGRIFKLIVGNGIEGSWNGYCSANRSAGRIVVDRVTGRPLVSVYGDMTFHFLDYTTVSPGQYAPLRIVVQVSDDDGDSEWDFRFQVVNGRIWLFDESYYTLGDGHYPVARLDAIALDGKAPDETLRWSDVSSPEHVELFDFAQIENRTAVSETWGTIQAVVKRNQPWLRPSFDHLDSVSFVHRMGPTVFDERFGWSNQDGSLVEVVADPKEKGRSALGNRWITTAEPAFYSISSGQRLATAKKQDATSIARHVRDRLMGTRMNCATLDWGWNPDDFVVESMNKTGGGRLSIVLTPNDREYRVNGGAMFYYQSHAYVHDLRVARSELEVEADTFQPVREIDYDREGGKLCEVTFGDYLEVRPGQIVPRYIRMDFPESEFTVDYQFEWRPEGLWILTASEARFASEVGPQREAIEVLVFNGPIAGLDDALQQVRETQQFLASGTPPDRIELACREFVFGRTVPLGQGTILFTLDEDYNLIAEVKLPEESATTRASMFLMDASGRLVGAAEGRFESEVHQTSSRAVLDFGRWKALGTTRFFRMDIPGHELPEGGAGHEVAVYAIFPTESLRVDVADDLEGKSYVKRATFAQDDNGWSVTCEVLSEDFLTGFAAATPIALLDAGGHILSAATESLSFHVERELVLGTTRANLPGSFDIAQAKWLAVGLNRGPTTGGPLGSTWGNFMVKPQPPLPPEVIEKAEDERALLARLKVLDDELRDGRYLRDYYFSNLHDREEAKERNQTPFALVEPRVPFLERCLTLSNPEGVRLACRLLGYGGSREHADTLVSLLGSSEASVSEAAAIGLGLLGDGRAMDRLVPVLGRRYKIPDDPQNADPVWREEYEALRRLQEDAGIALLTIGTDDAVTHLGEALLKAIEDDGSAGSLVYLLGHTRNPVALTYLRRSMEYGKKSDGIDQYVTRVLPWFQEDAHETIAESLKAGRSWALRAAAETADPYYAPLVKALVFSDACDERMLGRGVEYFENLQSDEGIAVLREIHDANLMPDATHTRLDLCRTLAERGDIRGFDYAFGVLESLEQPVQLPEDERQRERVERQRQDLRETAIEVFTDARASRSEFETYLNPRLSKEAPVLQRRVAAYILAKLPARP